MVINLLFASKFTAKISASVFAGAAVYCSLVEHPARIQCGTRIAATVWVPSFRRAAIFQSVFSSVSFTSAILAYYLNNENEWLFSALSIGFMLPYTLFAIMPTNKILLDPSVDRDSIATKVALVKWGKLHAVRSVVGVIVMLAMNYYA